MGREKPSHLPRALSFFPAPASLRHKEASVEQERNAYVRDIVWAVLVRSSSFLLKRLPCSRR